MWSLLTYLKLLTVRNYVLTVKRFALVEVDTARYVTGALKDLIITVHG